MADGTYERRGPREAELKRFERLMAAARSKDLPHDAVQSQPSAAEPTRVILSLGSNIEPRREMIERALKLLGAFPQTRFLRTSTIIETEPVDVPDAFKDQKFLNCVAVFETTLEPLDFSRRMHALEETLGRVRTVRNGPRTIDIDLIDFGGRTMKTSELILPHPRGRERSFVTEPLRELGITLG